MKAPGVPSAPLRSGTWTGALTALYLPHPGNRRRERQLLSSAGFLIAFLTARAVTHAQRSAKPSSKLSLVALNSLASRLRRRRPKHHHHLVWGILLLLGTGYAWLFQVGTGVGHSSRRGSQLTSAAYGVGSALTLDEFALWLNLEDDYWKREGRESIDAILLFGALLAAGFWEGSFLRPLTRALVRRFKP